MMPMAIDTTAITTALTDLGTAGGTVVAAAIAVAIALFGVPWLWRRAKKTVS